MRRGFSPDREKPFPEDRKHKPERRRLRRRRRGSSQFSLLVGLVAELFEFGATDPRATRRARTRWFRRRAIARPLNGWAWRRIVSPSSNHQHHQAESKEERGERNNPGGAVEPGGGRCGQHRRTVFLHEGLLH